MQLRLASSQGTPQLGQPHAIARTKRGSLAHVAYMDLAYSVTWPLNIIVTAEHLARYRKLLPVFLQVRSCCVPGLLHLLTLSQADHAISTGLRCWCC